MINMIRFIDLREQDTPGRFTFFDTITDRFEVINDVSVWDTFYELEQDFGCDGSKFEIFLLERYRKLCPDWVFGIAEMVIENIQDRSTAFRCDRMEPQYAIMSTETRTALVKELGRYMCVSAYTYMGVKHFTVCGLEVIINDRIKYGDVKVVGEPWKAQY